MISIEVEALAFARCAGFVWRAPGFSHPAVPSIARVALAILLALAFAPGIGKAPPSQTSWFVIAVFEEALLGVAIGFAASVLFDGVAAGGAALDDFVGIRGQNPGVVGPAGVGFGTFWQLAFITSYFALGGYNFVLAALSDAFAHVPPGGLADTVHWSAYAISLPVLVVRAAAIVAAPAIGLSLVAQVALVALTRVVPRFSSLQLSFGIGFGVVLLVTLVAAGSILPLAAHPWMFLPAWKR